MTESIRLSSLDVCGNSCPIAQVDLDGYDPPVVNEVLVHLQWDGDIAQLTDDELLTFRVSEMAAWNGESDRVGQDAVKLLHERPEICKAARSCAILQDSGECTYSDKLRRIYGEDI